VLATRSLDQSEIQNAKTFLLAPADVLALAGHNYVIEFP
jgi:hypothetical protein